MWGGLDGGLIWVYDVGWSWFVWVCLVWVDLGCGLIWVCVKAWRRWRFDRRWFFFVWVDRYVWVDLIFLWFLMIFRVGWSVCGLIGFFFGFWWSFMWVDIYFSCGLISIFCLVTDDGGDSGWVVMVAVSLWERGTVREWIIKISKIMNILINKCVK